MDIKNVQIQSKAVAALCKQAKTEYTPSASLPCPSPGLPGRIHSGKKWPSEFDACLTRKPNDARLFNLNQSPVSPQRHAPLPSRNNRPAQRQPGLIKVQKYDSRYPGSLLQPDTRPISQEQLASEVKSIYAGLTMVETKCIHVDRVQAAAAQDDPNNKLASDHWQALIAAHRTLLHEHHDFYLASQHPSASPALRRLAAKYAMPARMWKHGIRSFLELLRRRLPESVDHMLAFIYLAYQMMALLYETVHTSKDTWIECLGDLGCYRMAIEGEDIRDREMWTSAARSWYNKAEDISPTIRRLYHSALVPLHSRPVIQGQESSLTQNVYTPPILPQLSVLHINTEFIRREACLFERRPLDDFKQANTEFVGRLNNHIGGVTAKWKEWGVYTAVAKVCSWWKSISNEVWRIIKRPEQELQGLARRPNQFDLVRILLKSHKIVVTTCLCAVNMPLVSAASDATPNNTIPDKTRTPIFKFETALDYTILGLMILYLLAVFLLRVWTTYYSKAFHISYALTIAMGPLSFVFNRDEFADSIQTTVFAIWFTATLHTGAQYCYDNHNPTLHIISFLVLAIIPVWARIQSPTLSSLDILPPYVTLVALAAYVIHKLRQPAAERHRPDDEEHNGAIALEDRNPHQHRDVGVNTGQQASAPERLIRRNSNSSRNATLPNPSIFEVGDDSSDTASDRSNLSANPSHR